MILRYIGEHCPERNTPNNNDICDVLVVTSGDVVRVHTDKTCCMYSSFRDMFKEWEERIKVTESVE